MQKRKAAVFILLGQSNATGHGIPMTEEDRILTPLSHVFGLSREENQSLDLPALTWSGYTSGGMNLAEEQDHTYSVANCLAALWQKQADSGNPRGLPDLYVLQIAIGAEGVTEGYMWHPARPPRLIPGVLGTVDISLFPFSCRIFSLLEESFTAMDTDFEIIGLHWRGGENDVTAPKEALTEGLEGIYRIMLEDFNRLLKSPPVILHRIVCPDRMNDMDPTGGYLENMAVINGVFDRLAEAYENVSVFDHRAYPAYDPRVRGNGLFLSDAVHYTPAVNQWVAHEILRRYMARRQVLR